MPRVLYVTDSLMAGGIESQLVELVAHLDRRRFHPFMVCLYGPRVRDLHFAPQIKAASIPLETLDLAWGAGDKLHAIQRIIASAWRVCPHIVQAEGYHANLLTRLARPFMPPTALLGTVRGRHSPKQLLYERLSHLLCARLVVNAPHLARMLEHGAGVPPARIEHIPNGIDAARFAQPHDPDLRARIAPGARCVLVSMGRIGREKNMHWAVEALGLLKRQEQLPSDVRLFIVGPVEDAMARQQLDRAIARDALGDVVRQFPATPYPEDYYHAADACVLYSPAEGLANVSIESLAAGRPVVMSTAANAAAVIQDGVTGWVARSDDIPHLAETLHTVLAVAGEDLRRMRVACLARAADYTVPTMVQRYERLYEEMLMRGPVRPATAAQHT